MSVKKNDSIFAIMSLVLIGTVGSTAFYAVKSSSNAKAKKVAETAAENAQAEQLRLTDDLGTKSKEFATQVSSVRTELTAKSNELADLQSKHTHLTEMYEAAREIPADAKEVYQQLQITNKNLDDLKRRNETNEDLITRFLTELNVGNPQDALATIASLKTEQGNQIADVSLEPAKNIRETGDKVSTTDDPEIKKMLADGRMAPVARPPAGTETRKEVMADNSELLADFERIRKRNEFLVDQIQKAEKIMAGQSDLLARLTQNETTSKGIESLRPSIESVPDSNIQSEPTIELEVNSQFQSGPGTVVSGIEEEQFDVVPIPATDSNPRFPANAEATLIESYIEE